MKRNPRVVGEEGAKVMKMRAGRTVTVFGRVAIVGEVVVGNERGGIAVAFHRRRSGAGAEGGGVTELRHRGGRCFLSLYMTINVIIF